MMCGSFRPSNSCIICKIWLPFTARRQQNNLCLIFAARKSILFAAGLSLLMSILSWKMITGAGSSDLPTIFQRSSKLTFINERIHVFVYNRHRLRQPSLNLHYHYQPVWPTSTVSGPRLHKGETRNTLYAITNFPQYISPVYRGVALSDRINPFSFLYRDHCDHCDHRNRSLSRAIRYNRKHIKPISKRRHADCRIKFK